MTLRPLPLRALHAAGGAAFGPSGEWEVPLRYEDPAAEAQAARAAAGLADLSHFGRFVFKGPDRAEFLHGLLTSDVKGLASGRGQPSCLLTPKGKVTADFSLYNRGDDFLAVVPPEAAPALPAALGKYLPLSDTVLEAPDAGSFYLQGPRSADVLSKVFQKHPRAGECVEAAWEGRSFSLLSYPALKPAGTLILFPTDAGAKIWHALLAAGREAGLKPLGAEALEELWLEAGAPPAAAYREMELYPSEIGLDQAVNNEKGCYLGQEAVARLRTHGRAKHALARLKVEEAAAGAGVFLKDEAVGKIVAAARPAGGGMQARAVIRADLNIPGTDLSVNGRPAQVLG
ncbi:MAG: CAF17-like 4Fe-4S cluster assembly/insertion protein YgfZ [Elusimicrobiota bacterium]